MQRQSVTELKMKRSSEGVSLPRKRARKDRRTSEPLQSNGDATLSQESVQDLWNLLKQAAEKHPTHGVLFRNSSISSPPINLLYSELLQRATDRGAALLEAGTVKKGEPTLVFFEHAEDLLVWTWSLIA